MPGFYIYTSNQLGKLSKELAGLLAGASEDPLSSEMIVVHSKGMGQWLAMEIARYNGICANTTFPFPNTFLNRLFEMAGLDASDHSPYDTDSLTFRIMHILPQCLDLPEFESIKQYLADNDQFKLFQLSEKISETFDQYQIFRPEMIFNWEKGKEHHWQAQLWRNVFAGSEFFHRAGQRKRLMDKIRTKPESLLGLPDRIFLFGISYLPAFHLDVIAALAKLTDIHLLTINPCCEYWGDIVTDKEKKKITKHSVLDAGSDSGLYLETGNPLLASWGIMGREFLNMIQGFEDQIQTVDLYQDVGEKNMLTAIQSDILYLRDRSEKPPLSEREKNGKKDKSIQICSCHSKLREIEILQNNLLSMFEEDPELLPKDILVMAPDIAAYEPFIHAVFDHPLNEQQKIPYHVSDKSILKESSIIDGFFLLLEMSQGRFGVTKIMALLDIHGIKEKFGLADQDMGLIETWVEDTNIRWGIDASHRAGMGLPDFKENTWKAAFDRLLLGYAMPGNDYQLFEDILPYDNMEGSDAVVLGNFIEFFSQIVVMAKQLNREKTLEQWSDTLNTILEDFFLTDDQQEEEKQILRHAFGDIAKFQQTSENNTLLGLPIIISFLKNKVSGESSGTGFITGNVTFCRLLPFRSIPAKIICMLGMNSDAFPRDYFQPSFDLVAQFPRPGDRVKRNDDKYLFLQALISARDKLYISYVGQSNRDNSQQPPCVVVNELIDYMTKSFNISEDSIITQHRLQAFSEAYFKEDRDLFSYSMEDYETCVEANDPKRIIKTYQGFIQKAVTEPDSEYREVDIQDLGFFFSLPCKYFLETRLGIFLQQKHLTLVEEEPFLLDPLDRYQIGQDIVSGTKAGIPMDTLEAIQRSLGRLPHGTAGKIFFSEERIEAQAYMERIHSYGTIENKDPREFSTPVNDFMVSGKLAGIQKECYLQTVYAKSRPKYLLRAWINHLALCMTSGDTDPKATILICKDLSWQFHYVENSMKVLEDLLEIYWEGLKSPTVFFPEASYVYFEMLIRKKKKDHEALQAALHKWKGSDFSAGEADDAYVQLCFPPSRLEQEIRQKTFQETAIEIFAPLFEHCEKV